jgi:hypothetical protein
VGQGGKDYQGAGAKWWPRRTDRGRVVWERRMGCSMVWAQHSWTRRSVEGCAREAARAVVWPLVPGVLGRARRLGRRARRSWKRRARRSWKRRSVEGALVLGSPRVWDGVCGTLEGGARRPGRRARRSRMRRSVEGALGRRLVLEPGPVVLGVGGRLCCGLVT